MSSERMAAVIWIGGTVTKRLVASLCRAICKSSLRLEWADAQFKPQDANQLLEALDDYGGVPALRLNDDQATWGEFATLEKFLRRHRLSFTRRSDGKYDYDAELVEFRPGCDLVCTRTDASGEPTLGTERVVEALELLKKSRASLKQGKQPTRWLARAQRVLEGALPPDLPPLEPFEIEGIISPNATSTGD
jgi:hypothetical protein